MSKEKKPLRIYSVFQNDGYMTYRDFFLARSHYYAKRSMIEDLWCEKYFQITDFQDHELTSKVHKEFDNIDLSFLPEHRRNTNAMHISPYEEKEWIKIFYKNGWALKYYDDDMDIKEYSLEELLNGDAKSNEQCFYEKNIQNN